MAKSQRILSLLLLCVPVSGLLQAQTLREVFADEELDSLPPRSLRVELDATAFFRDNEYSSQLQDGYSLPGMRMSPRLCFNPLPALNIEAGASLLFFNGANRYPCFAYHDIGTWKGNQYQSGAHAQPWLRLEGRFKHLNVIVGNLRGGSNHQLIEPLYNAEQNLSADPEMGVQLLLHRPHVNFDLWLNWQSYQFELDSHQEAFTVGSNTRLKWQLKRQLELYFPLQLLIQHRGGEQDTTNLGVQTLCNGSVGAGLLWKPNKTSKLDKLDAQINAIGAYQQAGQLWTFTTGFALHSGISTRWFSHLNLSADYLFVPHRFVSLYGNPFYSTLPYKKSTFTQDAQGAYHKNYPFELDGLHTLHFNLGYVHTFAKHYTLGADLEVFQLNAERLHETLFSFGIYFRVNPTFLIKQF
ncbi:MAG: hypothetical protein KBT12_03350 [Bacteroidales bacterium]|nr:hypothetical protein [Candidatus Physcousia equi]